MAKTRFKGHETFYFREGWLSKAFIEMNQHQNFKILSDVKEGISKLGVGSNMVKAIKYWLMASHLVEITRKDNAGHKFTSLGQLIADQDPFLEDEMSLWLIHYSICSNFAQATTWNIFWNHFKGESFTSKDILENIKRYLENEDITYKEKSLENDISVLLQMYSKKSNDEDPEENSLCPISRLQLIKQVPGGYEKNMPVLLDGHELVVLYILLTALNEEGKTYNQVGYIELSKAELLLNNYMNLNRIAANEYIDMLKGKYLRVDNTAGLDMIYFKEGLDILKEIQNYYEGRE